MREHRLEVADVFLQYGEAFLKRWGHTVSPPQRRALRDIGICRTAALGGHIEQCDGCAHEVMAYNSCRNRHCPKCQSTARDHWLAERAKELLPVPYCHVVFTVPEPLAPLALQNPQLVYGLLFRAVSQTLLEIAADPRHLGAQIGFLAVLHTWSQNLLHHPHIHCVVPAGGLAPDGSRWIPCRRKFFLPVKVLSRLFRGKFLALLRDAFAAGKLQFHGQLAPLREPARFHAWLRPLQEIEWVVYAKLPFGGPEYVLKYLARYTHRVAISNGRLLSLENGQVTFQWRDSKDNNQIKTMTLDAVEFIRRFLLHILPSGFVKIRHFGFLSRRRRSAALELCRQRLPQPVATTATAPILTERQQCAVERRCPACRTGKMHTRRWISAGELLAPVDHAKPAYQMDSS
ncbi:MAG: IS91 family transposase [Acidobacteria bacterium]|nr:MAG: IS91 family transposase [Acidobacteriota bacterium]